MAIDPNSPAQVAALNQAVKDLQDNLNKVQFQPLINSASDAFSSLQKNITNAQTTIKELADGTSKASSDIVAKFELVGKAFNAAFTLTSPPIFQNLARDGGAATSTMAEQFDKLTARTSTWAEVTKKLMGVVPADILNKGQAVVRSYLEHASSLEKLETAYLDMQAATGKLGDIFSETGVNTARLDNNMAQFTGRLTAAAGATGLTTEQVSKWGMELGNIPGVFNSVINATDKQGHSLDALTGALTLASGAHRSVSEVIGAMQTAYENLGQAQGKVSDTTDKGARLFAMMSEASQKLGLRFSDTKGFLDQVATSFKMIGDNTDGSTKILERFSGALQNTGLTAKASVDVIQHMVGQMSKLEVGTKALISARTGGPGGLQGAFQVDQLLRQGRVDEVARMMERTLRQQLGPRIYSQEEAARSPQAAAGFFRQQQILQSGAFGGLAGTPEAATHILEALRQGPEATANAIRDSQTVVSDTIRKGESLQERSNTILNSINTSLDEGVALQEQQLLLMARQVAGTTGASGARELIQGYQERRRGAGFTAAQTEAMNAPTREADEAYTLGTKSMIGGVITGLEGMEKAGAEITNKIKNGAETASKIFANDPEAKARAQQEQQAQQRMTASRAAVQRGTLTSTLQRGMQTTPRAELATQIPRTTQVVKHEIDLKGRLPIDLKIDVEAPPGYQTNVSTSNPMIEINEAATRGGVGRSRGVR